MGYGAGAGSATTTGFPWGGGTFFDGSFILFLVLILLVFGMGFYGFGYGGFEAKSS